ncbi:MAG: hypothetical protein HYV97_16165 [Bdellovibrio sp.]|nr:hypothetical protein [Bdellovibrio sp.]
MKMSLLLALAFSSGVLAGTYEVPNLKLPNTPDTSKIKTKTADWQDMNDTKISDDETPVRQLASDVEETPVDPKDRGPSSNPGKQEISNSATSPSVDAEKNYQEKMKFWKYERVNHRGE